MANPFVYVQLHTQDHGKAKEFYSKLFKWRFTGASRSPDSYTEIDVGRGTGGGIMRATSNKIPSHWLPFVRVNDVDHSAEQAAALGGTIIVPPTNVPRKGRYSVIVDPAGAAFALWTPARNISSLHKRAR